MRNALPVMILAGGLGTRLKEETEVKPKPMVCIGGKPILWHIMKIYASFGFYRFIICLGYKGEIIKNYFLQYHLNNTHFTINTGTGALTTYATMTDEWEVTLIDTGDAAMTGARIARALPYVDTDLFFLTYGDAVADVNIAQTLLFHEEHKKIGTMTAVPLPARFGNLEYQSNGLVTNFMEKNKINDELINGGFFVFNRNIEQYLSTKNETILEQGPLQKLVSDQQLMLYRHQGFWQCMDTLQEKQKLELLWETKAPWKLWDPKKDFEPASSMHAF